MTTLMTPHDGLVSGRVVIVTAAAGTGIGSAVAARCLEEGGILVISDRHERRLSETALRLEEEFGKRPMAIRCDVTSREDIEAMMEEVFTKLGRIDVLVNNAGLGGTASVIDMTDDQWMQVLDVTLTGTFRATQAALRYMVPARSGVIVNVASVLGWRAQKGQAHYAAAKAGVMALTRCSAQDVAGFGVRINAVAPSLAMHENLVKATTRELLDQLASESVLGRAADPLEVADVILFLASEYSSYMTGEVVSVGGQHP